jgi:hypothetical protein
MATEEQLRAAFVKRLTMDSKTRDPRRKEFNQAIFIPEDDKFFGGAQVFTGTTLKMVLDCFDNAVRDMKREDKALRRLLRNRKKLTDENMKHAMRNVTDYG